ncbi:hypothetical protein B0H15DRAFT_954950 [Mycena belliarum]|uniref:Uncharacterized protein n=1 Tax=Mycena belliarum TaxID=1033014 RepID=A0AAD6TU16_9AGAR|nr:hypothetical protein B0H15DRAFT_954950 [Mycena belliae]
MNNATTTPTPAQELAALVHKVHALSKLALDMTKLTMEINDGIPAVIEAQVEAAIAALSTAATAFVRGTARTPNQMDALFPPGVGDHQVWYVVIRGREPGLYGSSVDADTQVNGIPGQYRQKKTSRVEALSYYRHRYNAGDVDKINEAPAVAAVTTATPVPAAPAAHT